MNLYLQLENLKKLFHKAAFACLIGLIIDLNAYPLSRYLNLHQRQH